MNTKENQERTGSIFKMPSRTKSPIKSTSTMLRDQQTPYEESIESMNSETDHIIVNLNL